MTALLQGLITGQQEARARKQQALHAASIQRQQALQDLEVLTRMHGSGRPVTPAGTVIEDRPVTQQQAQMLGAGLNNPALQSLAGQTFQVERPADQGRVATYKSADGRDHSFELFSDEDQTARQIRRMVDVAGVSDELAGARQKKTAAVKREIDDASAIDTPKLFGNMGFGDKIKPSQLPLAEFLYQAGVHKQDKTDAVEASVRTNERLVNAGIAKDTYNRQRDEQKRRDAFDMLGIRERGREAAAARRDAAKAPRGDPAEKEKAKIIDNLERAKDRLNAQIQEHHDIMESMGRNSRDGLFFDQKGNPVIRAAGPVKKDANNVKAMQGYLDRRKSDQLRLEAQREAIMRKLKELYN